ncbi:MAG: right-handed parallel beta-helix repeat-containing protein [Myxococcota bacterium]
MTVDGIVFDNGPRNRFKTEKNLLILRKAGDGKNPTPESGGLRVEGGCDMTIKNNVVMNVGATGGALSLWGGEGSKAEISNNLIINNTGEGVFAFSKYHPRREVKNPSLPVFDIHHNTILFSWKHDAIATYGGNSIKADTDTIIRAKNNVLGFNDYGGIDNIKKSANMLVQENLFLANKLYDYREFNTEMRVDVLEDEANLLNGESTDNISSDAVKVNVGERYAGIYASRVEISREAVDNAAQVQGGTANSLRGMLGLPLQASAVKMDADIWLPLLAVEEAVGAGEQPYMEKFGCHKP